MRNIRVGYQGMRGSNSEEAAYKLIEKTGVEYKTVEFVGLITSKSVMDELKNGSIRYGIMAIKNSLGGTVIETFEALKNEDVKIVSKHTLQINHCLFKRSEVDSKDINVIASHIQALRQTVNNRRKLFNRCIEYEVEDTAISAKYLSEGKLSDNTAVICRKNAGEVYGLELMYSNLEDNCNNYTEFGMFELVKAVRNER